MIKLWKVTCNGIGWSKPSTFYFKSRYCAEKFNLIMKDSDTIVSDGVKYAGRFGSYIAEEMYQLSKIETDEILRKGV